MAMTFKSKAEKTRVEFNWGFHDAQCDAIRGKRRPVLSFDRVGPVRPVRRDTQPNYAAGYSFGLAYFDMGGVTRDASSQPAFDTWQAQRDSWEAGQKEVD